MANKIECLLGKCRELPGSDLEWSRLMAISPMEPEKLTNQLTVLAD
jgi:hypothetical protein